MRRLNRAEWELIVVVASAGGLQALRQLFSGLPAGFPVPLAVVLHRSFRASNDLPHVLGKGSPLRVKVAEQGERPRPGSVYLAPSHHHLVVRPNRTFHLMDGRKIMHLCSAANPLFESAAYALDGGVIALVLTGTGTDGISGAQAVAGMDGFVIAQDPMAAEFGWLPRAAIAAGIVDEVLPLEEIAPALVRLVTARGAGVPCHAGAGTRRRA